MGSDIIFSDKGPLIFMDIRLIINEV